MTPIVGRSAELAALDAWLDSAERATPVLVLSGPAGIGKSALLRAVLSRAIDSRWTVLAATVVEGETGLARVSLADLLQAVPPERLETSEPVHREVLAAVRSLTDLQVDDRTVASSFAALLSSWKGRVLVAIDDEQWLDDQSATAILYAARRADPATTRFVFTRREEQPGPVEPALRDRTEVIQVAPLTVADTRTLVRARVGEIGREAMGTVVDTSGGNPLFALELAARLTEHGGPPGVPRTILDLLRERLARLSADARRALLVVALSPGARWGEVVAVVGMDAIDDAIGAHVLEHRGDVLIPTHPLLGTAAVQDSSPEERRDLHLLLAGEITDDLRHWLHAARGAATPDAALASHVAAAAERATARGRRRTATELAEHAFRLTPARSPDHEARLIQLVTCCKHSGDSERALDLLAEVPRLISPTLRARGWLLRIDLELAPLSELERYLDLAAVDVGDDPALRALVLVQRCAFAVRGTLTGIADAEQCAEEAWALPTSDPEAARMALFELAWARAERATAIDGLLVDEESLPGQPPMLVYSVRRVSLVARMWRGDLDGARAGFEALLDEAGERGEPESVTVSLTQLSETAVRAARWADAERWIDQIGLEQRFQDIDPGTLRLQALVAAGRGDVAAAREIAARSIELSRATELRWQEFEAWRATGLAAILAGDLGAARAVLHPVWTHLVEGGFLDPGAFPVAIDLAESLVVDDEGVTIAATIGETLRSVPDHPWAAAAADAVDGHVAVGRRDDARAVASFARAAEAFRLLGFRLDEARALCHAGAASRRQRKLREARPLLEEAVAVCEAIDSPGWAQHARAELARVGGRPASGNELTETEHRVAVLVAEGRRNRDVAKLLFVSESAVEASLSRIYSKLGIRSRTELSARMRRRPS